MEALIQSCGKHAGSASLYMKRGITVKYNLSTIIAKLECLVDLHIHLDGSVSVNSARELAEIEKISLPESDKELSEMLMISEDCRDLNEYLEKFSLPVSLMQSRESLRTASYNLCRELKAQGLMYAEIRFAPQKHCEKGLVQREVITSVLEGISESGFDARLILCCMRDGADNSAENLETVRLTSEFRDKGVCACDLAGAEALFPNDRYLYVFEEAAKLGVRFTVHSGEALGPESVVTAAENGAGRIGHGVRAAESEEATELLRRRNIPLEICPTSNVNTCVFSDVSEIPLRYFMDRGICVTINTDNMSVSSTSLRNEYIKAAAAFNLDVSELKKLLKNSVTASFTDDKKKEELSEKIEKNFAGCLETERTDVSVI